ncbi:hypothetical protein B4119_1417 [Parageobacillus caldoxylosilyticus]|uniref:Uncharacterized protein n=1 Tax=Saccharococcus caldoxylosilyticus TaxID=81408 RepID=A0A150LQY7_9BACL|nr:hypothetical protein B4119_1417 [Parageobacillus caldoxylosilyticus]
MCIVTIKEYVFSRKMANSIHYCSPFFEGVKWQVKGVFMVLAI